MLRSTSCLDGELIFKKIKNISEVQLIVVSFLLIVLFGTVLLCVPISTKLSGGINFVNALFTATSATCVTGLSVCDTFSSFSVFGQFVILLLIQLGGLGIITFTTATALFLRKKLDLKELKIAKEHTSGETVNVKVLIKTILICTFLFEFIGTAVLCVRFIPQFGLSSGVWNSLFMAVSSYCNAGFDILGVITPNEGSLTFYKTDALVSTALSLLTIIGGLGFVVMSDIGMFLYKRVKLKDLSAKFKVHSQLVILTTIILLVLSTTLFMCLEYHGVLLNLGFFKKLIVSFFYSASIRTAGFFSVPIASQRTLTKIITMFFMFIGASPASTGGGIKTTTFAVLFMVCICILKGNDDPMIFRHKISKFTVYKAVTILTLFLMLFCIFSFLIFLIEKNKPFLDVAYEVISALSTTGLSTGITPYLRTASKLLICLAIFAGRVGPVSLILAVTLNKHKRGIDKILPDSKIIVG